MLSVSVCTLLHAGTTSHRGSSQSEQKVAVLLVRLLLLLTMMLLLLARRCGPDYSLIHCPCTHNDSFHSPQTRQAAVVMLLLP